MENNSNNYQGVIIEGRTPNGSAFVSSNNKTQDSKRRKLYIGLTIGFVIALLVVIGVIVLVVSSEKNESFEDERDDLFDAETSMVEVMVAPSSATILIGNEPYANGEYEFAPGEYDVLIEKEGFQPYNGKVIVADKHKTFVTACLQPTQGNEDYYDKNGDDLNICQAYEELVDVSAWDQNALDDKIFEYTPFHGYDGFYVDPYYDDRNDLIVELTFKDCSQTQAVLESRAYTWMKEQGLDPNNYSFEKTWDCEE